jgi:hypothetical protein
MPWPKAAAPGLPDQRLQRLHRRADPGQVSRPEVDQGPGQLFSSPWKKKFFRCSARSAVARRHRARPDPRPGAFDDPRIHVGVSLRLDRLPDAAARGLHRRPKLDAQLDDGMKRFLADRTRNRFDAGSGKLDVSKIFDWYGKDFEKAHKGYDSLKTTFARHAAQLAATPEAQAKVRNGDYKLDFLEYDWKLNDSRRRGG